MMELVWPYRLNWVSSEKEESKLALLSLAQKMQDYYAESEVYYSSYIKHDWLWQEKSYLPLMALKERMSQATSVLEIGCGNAACLQVSNSCASKYTGIDFSEELVQKNRKLYPNARFKAITDFSRYDFPDESFDLVFSNFVIEHTVFPKVFLEESMRLVKPGGHLVILAPNFRKHRFLPSQKTNTNGLSGIQNLKRFRLFDASSAMVYNRLLMPLAFKYFERRKENFLVNLTPQAFSCGSSFQPDFDAVYIACFDEIREFCQKNNFRSTSNENGLEEFILNNRLGYLDMVKCFR